MRAAAAAALLVLALAASGCGSGVGRALSGGSADTSRGKQLFQEKCAFCHTLAEANAKGTVGPNLDEAKPSRALVIRRVTNGKGQMPSFRGQLSVEQIREVAAYVSTSVR